MELNKKQKEAFDHVINGSNIFITGSGGTGKTKLLLYIIYYLRTEYKYFKDEIAITSTTGSSALLIGGTTIHSFAGIGLGTDKIDELIKKIKNNFFSCKRWRNTKYLIIDEISMLSPDIFDKLNLIGQAIRENKKSFGGIKLILSGDFCQLPVVKSSKFCFESKYWDQCVHKTIILKQIIRQSDHEFQELLNEIRFGKCSKNTEEVLESRINIELEKEGIIPTKIYSKNVNVNKVNKTKILELIEKGNKHQTYNSAVKYESIPYKELQYLLNKINKDCPAKDKLLLAVDAQVILIKNINIEKGLVNGSRGIVTEINDSFITVKFLNLREEKIYISEWSIKEGKYRITKLQFPLKLAYALTIHKSQGTTIDFVETDISNSSIFEFGQVYTVLSRCKSLEGLKINKFDKEAIKTHPKVLTYYNTLEV
jgi:ATP-dependent DNA helicase PIF1